MAGVYGGAPLTIAAGASKDNASGIFDSTNVFRQQQFAKSNFSIEGYDRDHPEERGRLYVMNSLDLNPYTFPDCLSKRAWTFQENLMSQRLINFGKEQLYWRCIIQDFIEACPTREFTKRNHRTGFKSRDNHADLIRGNMNHKNTELPSWYGIVNDYIRRHITLQKDILIGISAIAKVMAEEMRQPPTAYKAGLWENDFHQGLLWRSSYDNRLPLIRHAEYIAPSWSWASVSASHMSFPRVYHKPFRVGTNYAAAEIIEMIIENENNDNFGTVQGGYVKLLGPTLEIYRHEIQSKFLDCPENAKDETHTNHSPVSDEECISESDLIEYGCKDSHAKVLLVGIMMFYKKITKCLIL
ncbi:hypothetical protein EAF00_010467 [Botryotinia globosa]|nr:hypothetical protein EAF00_010467 [Botryotinia globosa]